MMETSFELSTWSFVMQLARGLLIGLMLWGLGWLIAIAPISRARRRWLERLGPIFVVAVGLLFLVSAVQELFASNPTAMSLVAGLTVLGLGTAMWWPLRDLIAGVFLRAGNTLRPGDEVEVSGVRGRIERMGHRSMVVLASQGEVILPYGAIARSAIVRASGTHGATSHLFRVDGAPGVSALELRRAVVEGGLLCHWSSLARDPQVRSLEDGALEVTVFALHAGFGPEIEAAVRARVATVAAAIGDAAASGEAGDTVDA